MLIDQTTDTLIEETFMDLNWSSRCGDSRYKTDTTFRMEYLAELYDEFIMSSKEALNDAIAPFIRHGFHVDRFRKVNPGTSYFGFQELFNVVCRVKYSEDDFTNPFECSINVVAKQLNNGDIKYCLSIWRPRRLYKREYLDFSHMKRYVIKSVKCNQSLFLNRGFKGGLLNKYNLDCPLVKWSEEGGYGDQICGVLKKTITKTEDENIRTKKSLARKKALSDIKMDEILSMMEEINAEIKPTNLKMLLHLVDGLDHPNSPLNYHIVLSNNPEQNDENLNASDKVPLFSFKYDKQYMESMEPSPRLYSWSELNDPYDSFGNKCLLSLVVTYDCATDDWIAKFIGYIGPRGYDNCKFFKKTFHCEPIKTSNDIDGIRNYILDVILADHSLYKMNEKDS